MTTSDEHSGRLEICLIKILNTPTNSAPDPGLPGIQLFPAGPRQQEWMALCSGQKTVKELHFHVTPLLTADSPGIDVTHDRAPGQSAAYRRQAVN